MRPGPPQTRMTWVATPPPGSPPPHRAFRQPRYAGPPSYPVPPRWGLPPLTWRWPTAVPGTRTAPLTNRERMRLLGRRSGVALWLTAASAGLAAVGEVWRYVLLVLSRGDALSATTVNASDALVFTGALVSMIISVLAVVLTVLWLLRARQEAAESSGLTPARSDREVLLGLLVPGLNLFLPGSVLAELEHAVLRQPAGQRPRPSRLVLVWWGGWVVGVVLFVLTLLWHFRGGVQALADGVVLHAITDLVAVVVAALTAVLVRRLTALLAPMELAARRPPRVVRIVGAPAPELRRARPAGAVR